MKRIALGVAGLAAVATIVVGLWSAWSAEAQTVRWVNAAPDPAGEATECATAFPDIASALAAAGDGDIIRLCEGTYAGNLTVDMEVTIEGREGASIADVVIEEADAEDGLIIVHDDVIIQHLTLKGPGGTNAGINNASPGYDNLVVRNVDISDWAVGVVAEEAKSNTIEKSNIHENETGVMLVSGESNRVLQNEITANTAFGVLVISDDQTVVEDNRVFQNEGAQLGLVDGVLGPLAPVHVRLARNDIETIAGADGIMVVGAYAESFVQIGGSPDRTNNFSGPFDPVAGDYYVELDCDSENTVDATQNWWGSADRTDIANRIFNDADEPARGYTECGAPDDLRGAVVFEPWATAAWTPTATPSPTATATATATPTATPPAGTRDFSLESGWNNFVWTGADGTAAGDVLSCIAGELSIAYMWGGATTGYLRYVPGRAEITTLETADKYDALLVLVTADTQCTGMPVEP